VALLPRGAARAVVRERASRNRELYGSVSERASRVEGLLWAYGPLSAAQVRMATGWPAGVVGGALAALTDAGRASRAGHAWTIGAVHADMA
jgi:hypothetical protein